MQNLMRSMVCWRKNRKARAQLHRLDDHVLKDIGINRFDITSMNLCSMSRNSIKHNCSK